MRVKSLPGTPELAAMDSILLLSTSLATAWENGKPFPLGISKPALGRVWCLVLDLAWAKALKQFPPYAEAAWESYPTRQVSKQVFLEGLD